MYNVIGSKLKATLWKSAYGQSAPTLPFRCLDKESNAKVSFLKILL